MVDPSPRQPSLLNSYCKPDGIHSGRKGPQPQPSISLYVEEEEVPWIFSRVGIPADWEPSATHRPWSLSKVGSSHNTNYGAQREGLARGPPARQTPYLDYDQAFSRFLEPLSPGRSAGSLGSTERHKCVYVCTCVNPVGSSYFL